MKMQCVRGAILILLAASTFAQQQLQSLPLGARTAKNLLRPATARINGLSTASQLPQLDVCGCQTGPAFPEQINGSQIVTAFGNYSDVTSWNLVQTIKLKGQDAFHTEGMVLLDEFIYISAVEVLNRSRAEGRGWILQFDLSGNFVDKVQLGEGIVYHPGGIDTDGEYIYVPVAEYHAGNACGATLFNCTLPGTAIMYRVTPDLQEEKLFTFDDHLGSVSVGGCTGSTQYLDASNWGSRTLYRFTLNGTLVSAARNQQSMFDYQDCKGLPGCSLMVCSGIKNFNYVFGPGITNRTTGPQSQAVGGSSTFQVGGLALVDPTTGIAVNQVPINSLLTPQGNHITVNPMWVTNSFNGTTGLRWLFAPDDNKGSVVVVRAI